MIGPTHAGLAGFAALVLSLAPAASTAAPDASPRGAPGDATEWPAYGGGAGLRYSPLADVHAGNVAELEVAWTHHSGDLPMEGRESAHEVTPILVDGTLYYCTPHDVVFALDPETGAERWSHDPGVDRSARLANAAVCRGVSTWRDPAPPAEGGPACRRRIFVGTNDARLIALDARSGAPCADFGVAGEVDLTLGVGEIEWPGEYQVTSPPVVVHDLVVVGTAVSDNQRTDAPAGVVRAYDARSGALRWAWDPVSAEALREAQASGYALGTPNVWAPLVADEARDLVFAPTGNPSPDYFSGGRRRGGRYGSSVVALRASTGDVVWHFQTVHEDLWDYDVPAQPTLVDLVRDGGKVPAVVQTTKMGHIFVLHRETGVPLLPVEERPVPQGGVPGEKLSPSQPFPVKPPPLTPASVGPDDAWGLTPIDRRQCRKRMEGLRNEGIFTPPSLQGSLMVPGNAGGSNWGGVAVDPVRQLLVANLSHLPFIVSLFPAEEFAARRAAEPGVEISPQRGTPYGMRREAFLSLFGLPCVEPPWGRLVAVDLSEGEIVWDVPHGTVRDIAPIPIPWRAGTPTLGGPLVTAGGVVFIGAAMDAYLRAYALDSGEELWKGRLPAAGIATPMTYRARAGGAQYVVIAAGGHSRAGLAPGDALVAFRLRD